MKLAVVIQRYGVDVAGGAEAHCRGLVHALGPAHNVEVLTTCALDYITWKNHYPTGTTTEDGVRVSRFANRRERDVRRFGAISDAVFHDDHTAADERKWILENGPVCPDLVAAVQSRRDIDYFLIYSYRYYTAAMAAGAAPDRAVLVPTAEDDPAISLGVFSELFRSVRGLLYLTPEEQLLIEGVSGTTRPSAIIGTGLTVTAAAPRWIERFALPAAYVFYGGRIDRNKGVDQLFRYYTWLASTWPEAPDLVLAGHQVLDVPAHPKIRYLGYVSDDEKAALLAGASIAIMPSAFESLSIFVLEAWAHGTPVLVNAKCKVLEGQCRRSQGGLYYRDLAEFAAMMRLMMSQPELRRDLGAAGRAYVDREYSWDIAASRTTELLKSL
jgi:glycosyltransferase involved in cell wall biosynthesis